MEISSNVSLQVQQTPNPDAHDPILDPPLDEHSSLKNNFVLMLIGNYCVHIYSKLKIKMIFYLRCITGSILGATSIAWLIRKSDY